MFAGKMILLGVTGSIAAYKAASLASMLKKNGADVHVLMTCHATEFISPVTFEELTGNRCVSDIFDRNFMHQVEHIALAKRADLLIVAPASANVIGKLACGIADDMLTTTALACKCPKLLAPAMNTRMFEAAIVQDNMQKLSDYGWHIIQPATGYLACGDTGSGKLPDPSVLYEHIAMALCKKDLAGRKVVVTAGPTREAVDAVRFLTNYSSGKMGCALAKRAAYRGADVTLICGPISIDPPMFTEIIRVQSAAQMYEAVTGRAQDADIVIKAAAVADYTVPEPSRSKHKKTSETLTLTLTRTKDILFSIGEERMRRGAALPYICGFAMETEELIERAKEKLHRKRADMIVANSICEEGAGFAGDTNVCTLITADDICSLGQLSKEETAERILDEIVKRMDG